jgi:hypothetical protein
MRKIAVKDRVLVALSAVVLVAGVVMIQYVPGRAVETQWLPSSTTCTYLRLEHTHFEFGHIEGFRHDYSIDPGSLMELELNDICRAPLHLIARYRRRYVSVQYVLSYSEMGMPTARGAITKTVLSVNLSCLIAILMLPLVIRTTILANRWRRHRRKAAPYCAHCGYCLTGNESGTCPECGREINVESAVESENSNI